MAITEGGVRFPIHLFVRHDLQELTLTSSQLSTNSYPIITSIIELRRREVLNFRIEELFGAYSLDKNPSYGRYYLASRPEYKDLLIESLLDSES